MSSGIFLDQALHFPAGFAMAVGITASLTIQIYQAQSVLILIKAQIQHHPADTTAAQLRQLRQQA